MTRPSGVRVQRVLRFDAPMARGLWWAPSKMKGRHIDKTKQPRPWRERENRQTGLAPVGNTPLSPPAAVLLHGKASHVIFRSLSLPYKSRSLATPEGEVCSPLPLPAVRVILSTSEESRYSPHLRQTVINTSRQEGAACGGFSLARKAVVWFY